MSRIRTIKPDFWTSEQVMMCSHSARLLFIGMWNFCDDGGNHPASILKLKTEVFPGDSLNSVNIHGMLTELSQSGLLVAYEAEGKFYWHVTGWQHQLINRPSKKFPSFSKESMVPFENSLSIPGVLIERHLPEGKGRYVEGSNSLTSFAQTEKEPTALPAPNPKDKPKQVRSKGGWPGGFALDDDLQAYAVEKLPAGVDVGRLWEQFEAHHRKTGSEFKDWRQAWRTWVLNAEGFGKLPMLKTPSGSDSGFIARAAEAKRRWVTPEIGATAGERTSVDTQASPDSPEPLDGAVIGSTVNQQSLMEPF